MQRSIRVCLAVLAPTLTHTAAAQNLFDVDKAPPVRAFLWWEPPQASPELLEPKPGPQAPDDPKPPARPLPDPAQPPALPLMARVLAGGFELSKDQLAALRRAPGPEPAKPPANPNAPEPLPPAPFATLVLAGKSGTLERIDLLRSPRGDFLARRQSDGRLRALKPEIILPLSPTADHPGDWAPYANLWHRPPTCLTPGLAADVPRHLHRPSSIRLDERTIVDRGLRPARFRVDPASTQLGDATIRLRPPKGYQPKSPVGLLVWIDPSPAGLPPDMLLEACDELALAVVGVSQSGNDCGTGDRTQRTLDALATAEGLLHIDRARVYATGLSGGGRMSSIVAACFPDVFAGAVSMAGVAHSRDALNQLGKVWPAYFLPPTGKRLDLYKSHRLAATTGPNDFNHEQTIVLTDAMKDAGLNARAWTIEGLGHEPPDPATFTEALRWVDEPARTAAAQRDALGATLLKALDDRTPPPADPRKALLDIMDKAPWSPAAWTAAQRLGLDPTPTPTPTPRP